MIPRELVCGMNVKEQISEEKIGNESRELSASLREQTASVHRIESNCRPNRFLLLNQNYRTKMVFQPYDLNRHTFPENHSRTPNNATSGRNTRGVLKNWSP